MVAKIIAWGRDRAEAMARLRDRVARDHGRHRRRDHHQVVPAGAARPPRGDHRLGRHRLAGPHRRGNGDRAHAGGRHRAASPPRSTCTRPRKAWSVPRSWRRHAVVDRAPATPSAGRSNSNYQGQTYRLTVGQIGPRRYRVDGDSGELVVDVDRLSEFESRLTVGDRRFQIVTVAGPTGFLVEVDGISHRISQDEAGLVRASSPAVVVALPVAVGDQVEAGCHAGGAGEHEDGNRGARTVRGSGSGDLRHGQQPGRCRRRAAALRPGR